MPIAVSFDLSLLDDKLTKRDRSALERGAFDAEEVWYEYLTQDDGRVRPAHRALHGTVWRVGDPAAPVPPIDFGCRCFMRYVAAPDSPAARILPEAEREPEPRAEVFADYLDDQVDGWRGLAEKAAALPPAERQSRLYLAMRKRLPPDLLAVARELARMALEAVGA